MRYQPQRAYKWSEAIAYSVGLMASDGCLSKDGRHISLVSIDLQQLNNFTQAIGRPIKIGTHDAGTLHPAMYQAYRVQMSDVAYYDFLMACGLTPAKSKTIGHLIIPDQWYADFLRGLFDGDGSTYGYMDKRWKASFMFYIIFSTASLQFLKYLQTTNSKLFGVTAGSFQKSRGCYQLRYAKSDSHILLSYMYNRTNCLCLERKRQKLYGFAQRDKTAIIV